jgi:hypothetical protein
MVIVADDVYVATDFELVKIADRKTTATPWSNTPVAARRSPCAR